MRAAFVVALSILSGLPAYARPPALYLHCVGENEGGKRVEHTVALNTKTATIDGSPNSLGIGDSYYDLLAKNPVAAMFGRPTLTLMEIDRVTGRYEMSEGTTTIESGRCDKMRRKL